MDWGATQNTCEPSINDIKHAQATAGTSTTFAATLTSMSSFPDLISKTKKLGVDLKMCWLYQCRKTMGHFMNGCKQPAA